MTIFNVQHKKLMEKLKVVELFAGVGGFRIGLENTGKFEVIWSNQWEPSTKTQHASLVYESVFGNEGHSCENIEEVPTKSIPDCDVLVGGFPCQDYSVATSLKNSKGLRGKKGVLWWSIDRILREKKNKPKYLILENVDRLLKSPASQRGRDFAIMLKCLDTLGYVVEWRVINAADYGFPQKRRRVFILGYLKGTKHYETIINNPLQWISEEGVLASGFTAGSFENLNKFDLLQDLTLISEEFNLGKKVSPFENSGVMYNSKVITQKSFPYFEGVRKTLGDVILNEVDDSFYISDESLDKWYYVKKAKSEKRVTKEGFEYNFSEGDMSFPDPLDKPSRTIITSEGGKTPSRTKHTVETKGGIRRLHPIELERLNGFPDNHTKLEGITDNKRAFFMGNALVTGVIELIGENL